MLDLNYPAVTQNNTPISNKFCFLDGSHAYARICVNSGSGAVIYLVHIEIFAVINNNSDWQTHRPDGVLQLCGAQGPLCVALISCARYNIYRVWCVFARSHSPVVHVERSYYKCAREAPQRLDFATFQPRCARSWNNNKSEVFLLQFDFVMM